MGDLVASLKAQHQAVLKMVAQLDEHLAKGELDRVNALLGRLKTELLAHLEQEDRELYPGLVRQAEQQDNKTQLTVAQTFSTSMGVITQGITAFLARYPKVTDAAAFAKDWKGIVEVLQKRIKSEESSLYPLYQRGEEATASGKKA